MAYHLHNGWSKGSCPHFYSVQRDLIVGNGLVLRRNRIAIPQSMCQDMLDGHLGIEKCKRRAREAIYCLGINMDIEKVIGKCDTCLRHHFRQTKTYQSNKIDFVNLVYILVIDYYPIITTLRQLPSRSAHSVITHMKGFFC